MSKVIDIEDAIIMSRMFQYGWSEEYKKKFEKAFSEALEIKSFDLAGHDSELLNKVAEKLKVEMIEDYPPNINGVKTPTPFAQFSYRDVCNLLDKVVAELKAEV